jgi:hypothetical protein
MLCLTVWFGLIEGSVTLHANKHVKSVQDGFKVDVVSKLSNKYLGQIHVNTKLCTFQRLQDMQLQASCLMRHATRFPRDVLFWLDGKELLPHHFAYKTELEPHEEARINELLEQAQQAGLLSMMWNEDDYWADYWARRRCETIQFDVNQEEALVCLYNSMTLPMELLYLENKNVTKWVFTICGEPSQALKLIGFIKHAQRCTKVDIVHITRNLDRNRKQYEGNDLTVFLSSLT